MSASVSPDTSQPTASRPTVNLDAVDFSGILRTLRPLADSAMRLVKEWTWPADAVGPMLADLADQIARRHRLLAWTDGTLDLTECARQLGQWGAWTNGTTGPAAVDLPLSARRLAELRAWTDVPKRATPAALAECARQLAERGLITAASRDLLIQISRQWTAFELSLVAQGFTENTELTYDEQEPKAAQRYATAVMVREVWLAMRQGRYRPHRDSGRDVLAKRLAQAAEILEELTASPSKLTPAGQFAELRQFASGELIGIERAVIKAICNAAGSLRIVDLAMCEGVQWNDPYKGFEGVQRRLNPKIKGLRWRLIREDGRASLIQIGANASVEASPAKKK